MTLKRWVVVESPQFSVDLQGIGPAGHDWSDSMLGVRWYLERGPLMVGYPTQDKGMRILPWDTPDGLPELKLFYSIEDDRVVLLRARAAPDPVI